jgi:CRP-like cAMP-binding protein
LLLDSLSEPTRKRLLSHLRPVALPIKARLYDPEEEPRHVHFLDSGLASIVVSMADGGTVEVATVGREGMPQGMHLLGPTPVPTRCFMQIGGHGLRMDFKAFAKIYAEEEEVRRSILGYAQYQASMGSQIVGCNRLHGVEPRLARWLLIVSDRIGGPVLKLTQEFLAQMIGSQRTTVTAVAGALQERGLIRYARGTVRILDRPGLEQASCECYPVTRKLLESLYGMAGQSFGCWVVS